MKMIFGQGVACFSILYIVSIILVMGCGDWFLVWLGLEVNMMSFISLIYCRGSNGAEVCMKYFFIQSLGSGVLLMMFYSNFVWFEYISLLILSYKIGSGPFYFWFPAICESLGWGGCYLLMSVQKVLPLLLISLVVSGFLWFIVISSMLFGAFGSFNQKSTKRLMAYSSIHHVGWMMVSDFVSENFWFIYLILYSLLILGVVWSMWKDKILSVGLLQGMSSKWTFVLGMLSMGGVPPMLGFYLKWWLFFNMLNVDYSLLLMMVFTSVIMFYVYLRVVYSVFMGSSGYVSWGSVGFNIQSAISYDLFYMMGINVGVVVWLGLL